MGWWNDLVRALNEGIAHFERATGVDIPGVGTDLSKERKKKESEKKEPPPRESPPPERAPREQASPQAGKQSAPQPQNPLEAVVGAVNAAVAHFERATGVDIPYVGTDLSRERRASRGGGGSAPRRRQSRAGTPTAAPPQPQQPEQVQQAPQQAQASPWDAVVSAVNTAVAHFERFTGFDIPHVGTTLTEEERREAPLQKYIQQATDLKTYGSGWTVQAVQDVQRALSGQQQAPHPQPHSPEPQASRSPPPVQHPVDVVLGAAHRFFTTAATTFAGGLAFLPDTLSELGKAGEKLVKGDVQGAVYHATRPAVVLGAGLVGLAGKVSDWFGKTVEMHKKNIEAVVATGQAVLQGGKVTDEHVKKMVEAYEAAQRALYSTAELGGSAVALYGLGKVYGWTGHQFKKGYLAVKSRLSKGYVKDPGVMWVEGTTIPKTREQLLAMQGREVTGVHMTSHPFWGKAAKQGEALLIGSSKSQAVGWRYNIDARHFYISAPHGGKTTAYLGYVGIGPRGSPSHVTFHVFPPKKYMIKVTGKVGHVPKSIIRAADRGDVATVARWVGAQSGKITVPTENLMRMSTEGQFVIPAKFEGYFATYPGSKLILKAGGWTIYKQAPGWVKKFPEPIQSVLRAVTEKWHDIYILEGKPVPVDGKVVGGKGGAPKLDLGKYNVSYSTPHTTVTLFDLAKYPNVNVSGGGGASPSVHRTHPQASPPVKPQGPQGGGQPQGGGGKAVQKGGSSPSPPRTFPQHLVNVPNVPDGGKGSSPRPSPSPPPKILVVKYDRGSSDRDGGSGGAGVVDTSPPPPPDEEPAVNVDGGSSPPPDDEPPPPPPRESFPPQDEGPPPPPFESSPMSKRGSPPSPPFTPLSLFKSRVFPAPKKFLQTGVKMRKLWFKPPLARKLLLADLLSVTKSHALFGRATHPKPTPRLWKMAERTLFMRIPTKELMALGSRVRAAPKLGTFTLPKLGVPKLGKISLRSGWKQFPSTGWGSIWAGTGKRRKRRRK